MTRVSAGSDLVISRVCVSVSWGKVAVIVLYWMVVPAGRLVVTEMTRVSVSRGSVETIVL
jgi:hypothetical protein